MKHTNTNCKSPHNLMFDCSEAVEKSAKSVSAAKPFHTDCPVIF